MTDPLKILTDIRAALDAEIRLLEAHADGTKKVIANLRGFGAAIDAQSAEKLPEPTWEWNGDGSDYVLPPMKIVAYVIKRIDGEYMCGINGAPLGSIAPTRTLACAAVESAWKSLPAEKRAALGMATPAPKAEPLPTPLPCAHCGSNAESYTSGMWCVGCRSCQISTGFLYDTLQLAIAAWNRRAQPDALTRAAIAVAEADSEHYLMWHGTPSESQTQRVVLELHTAREAYAAAKSAARKAVQS